MFVDATCSLCRRDGKGAYRMVGSCSNCGAGPILVLRSVTHEVRAEECPVCHTSHVLTTRLATDDEIPVNFGEGEK